MFERTFPLQWQEGGEGRLVDLRDEVGGDWGDWGDWGWTLEWERGREVMGVMGVMGVDTRVGRGWSNGSAVRLQCVTVSVRVVKKGCWRLGAPFERSTEAVYQHLVFSATPLVAPS